MPSVIRGSGESTLGGALDVQGVLTYEDVTSVDSVGIITARAGIDVSGGNANIGPSANANGHGLLTLSQTALSAFNALVIQQGNTQFTATDGLHIGIDAGVNAYIKQYENRDIYFTTGNPNSEKLRITSAGNIGIGTNNPAGQFQVGSASNNGSHTIISPNLGLDINDGAINLYQATSNVNATPFIISTDVGGTETEKLRFTAGGNLGIGSTAPVSPLDVEGTISLRGHYILGLSDPDMLNIGGITGTASLGISTVRIFTSDNVAVYVDSDGEVTKPLQPRFHARLLTDHTTYDGRNVGGTWILYNTTDYNIGGHFKTSGGDQGRFVAPVDGMYLFQAAASIWTGNPGWSQSWFDVDGSRKLGSDWVLSNAFDMDFAQNSVQIYLNAGEKIGFHPYNNNASNTVLDSVHHTWFKGCLLG